jgi:hypothetical protein
MNAEVRSKNAEVKSQAAGFYFLILPSDFCLVLRTDN